jgi:predicted ATPase
VTPALRRQQIELQVALVSAVVQLGGHATHEARATVEKARLLIERAEALGEPPEDPLLLLSVLHSLWSSSYAAFKRDAAHDLAAQFLALAEKQETMVGRMIGHRLMGTSTLVLGDFTQSRAHFDQAIALYDPSVHRTLASRFGQDIKVVALCHRSVALWCLGYPDAALKDAEDALEHARKIDHAATLMHALAFVAINHIELRNHAAAAARAQEVIALADAKGAFFWKTSGMLNLGVALALAGNASDAVEKLTMAIKAWRSAGVTMFLPWYLSHLARVYAALDRFDDAQSSIGEAIALMETTEQRSLEAKVHCAAGEIALSSPQPDAARAQVHFERALSVAREQRAKSWELRAATSLARLWRDQGRQREAWELLSLVYDWFAGGFITLDLMDAKALLDELAPSGRTVAKEPA